MEDILMPKFGKTSRENLKGVDSRLQDIFNEVVKQFDCSILEGLRTQERQEQLYKEGKTKTLKSKHLKGRAIDAVPYPISWENTDRMTFFAGYVMGIASQVLDEEDFKKFRWGRDWGKDWLKRDKNETTFLDYPHFELK